MAIKLNLASLSRNPLTPVPKRGGGVMLHLTKPIAGRANDVGTAPVHTYTPPPISDYAERMQAGMAARAPVKPITSGPVFTNDKNYRLPTADETRLYQTPNYEQTSLQGLANAAEKAFALWEMQGTQGVNGIIYWVNDLLVKANAPVIGKKDYAEENRKYAALQMDLAGTKEREIAASMQNSDWTSTVVTALNGGLSLLQSLAMGFATQGGQLAGQFLADRIAQGGAISVGQLARTVGYKAAIAAVKKAVDEAGSRVGVTVASSVMPAWISSGIEGGSIYRELTDMGKSPARASAAALASIAGTALSESMELDGMYRTWGKNVHAALSARLVNALGQATSETVQELGQNLWQNGMRMLIGQDDTQKLATAKETVDTIIGIFPSSFLFGAGTFNARLFRQQNSAEVDLIIARIERTFDVDEKTASAMLDEAITKWGPTVRDVFLSGIDTKKIKLSETLEFMQSSDPYVKWLVGDITRLGIPVGQPSTVAKPVTSLAEIPKAVPVGQPQTVSGGVKPTVPVVHRYQIPARTEATPQNSPSTAISERETSVPTPPVETAPQIIYNKPVTEMTEDEFVNKVWEGYPTAPEGYTLLYHATPEWNVDSILKHGLLAGTEETDGRRGVVWATTEPTAYTKGSALIVFRVPNNDPTVTHANQKERMVRKTIAPEDIVQVYHALYGDKGGLNVDTRQDVLWSETEPGSVGRTMNYRITSPTFKVAESPTETAPQIAQNAWESGVSWTTERVVSAIRSGKGLIPEEVLVQFATDHPDGVESGGKLIKVVVPVSAEGQSWSPRVVKVVQADGTLDFPAVRRVAPAPVAEVAPTPHVMRAVDAPTGYRGPLDYSEPPVSKMEIPPTPSTEPSVVAKEPWQMTKDEYDAQTLPNKVAFAIVKDGKVLLSGTDNKIGYLAGLAEEQKADLYIGDSVTVAIDTEPLIMGYTFAQLKAKQSGGEFHRPVTSKMPKNAIQIPTYSQTQRPSITNTAPLPAGQTTSGEAFAPSEQAPYTQNIVNPSGTGGSIMEDTAAEILGRKLSPFDEEKNAPAGEAVEETLKAEELPLQKSREDLIVAIAQKIPSYRKASLIGHVLEALDAELAKTTDTLTRSDVQDKAYRALVDMGIPKEVLKPATLLKKYRELKGEKGLEKFVTWVQHQYLKYDNALMIDDIVSLQEQAYRGVYATQQLAIEELMKNYRTGKLSAKHRLALEEVVHSLQVNPAQDVDPKLMKALEELDKTPLRGLDNEALYQLRQKLSGLIAEGKDNYRAWSARQRTERKAFLDAVLSGVKPLGGLEPLNVEQQMNKFRRGLQGASLVNQTLEPIDYLMKEMGLMETAKRPIDREWNLFLYRLQSITEPLLNIKKDLGLTNKDGELIKLYQVMRQGRKDLMKPLLLKLGMTEDRAQKIRLSKNQSIALAYMDRTYERYYALVSSYMAENYNVVVPKVDYYAPLLADPDIMHDATLETNTIDFYYRTKTISSDSTKTRHAINYLTTSNAFTDFLGYVTDMQYMLSLGKTTRQIFEAVNSREFAAKAGELSQDLIKDWADLIARRGGASGQQRIYLLDLLRKNTSVGYMAGKLGSTLIQLTAAFDGFQVLGLRYMREGSAMQMDERWIQFLRRTAPEVYQDNADPDIETLTMLKWTSDKLYAPLIWMDAKVRRTVYLGSFAQWAKKNGLSLEDALSAKRSPETLAKVREGMQFAMEQTRKVQGTSSFKDQPLAISRGRIGNLVKNRSFGKAIMHFQSFNLFRWANIKDTIWSHGLREGKGGKALGGIFWLLLMSALGETFLRRASRYIVSGGTEKFENESVAMDTLRNMVESVPFVGPVTSMFMYGNNPIPALQALADAGQGINNTFNYKGKYAKMRAASGAIRGLGAMAGSPGSAQIAEIVKAATNAAERRGRVHLKIPPPPR